MPEKAVHYVTLRSQLGVILFRVKDYLKWIAIHSTEYKNYTTKENQVGNNIGTRKSIIKVRYLFQPRGSTLQCAEGFNSVNYYKRTLLGIDSLITIHYTIYIAEDNLLRANKTHNFN